MNYKYAVLLLLMIPLNAICQNESEAILQVCVPQKYFTLENLRFSDNLESIKKKHGEPISLNTYTSEDDGGIYTGQELHYNNFVVSVNKLRGVERIYTTSPKSIFALGIHVGMPLSKVSELMHFNAFGETRRLKLNICGLGNGSEQEIIFHFPEVNPSGYDPKLTKIEVLQYGP